MKKVKFGQTDALIDYLIDGNTVTRLDALLIFGVQNITAVISNLRKQGYLVKRTKIPFIKALVRINEKVKVQVPKNLPVKDIEISEYWISK
tara:strand:+ start:275 stop:547 length:273 start_codon:yes stop_codon:yes gene_type:complete